jgi:hypothetical protein
MLYLGVRVAPPITPYDGKCGKGTVHTEVLKEQDSPVRVHFTAHKRNGELLPWINEPTVA